MRSKWIRGVLIEGANVDVGITLFFLDSYFCHVRLPILFF